MSLPAGRAGRLATIAVAAVTWLGLALQFYVSAGLMRANGHGLVTIVMRYFSYFTVLTNGLVAITATVPLVAPGSRAGRYFALPSVRTAVASYIALVGIAYSLLLRHVWSPEGLALVSDQIQHDVVPILYVALWVFSVEKGTLRWSDLPRWLIYPTIYLAVALIQGAMTGFYPYHFIDAGKLGYPGALAGMTKLVLAFLVIGLLAIAIDRLMGRRNAGNGRAPAV
jgi:hypothetical protein